jgi:hypothetical protein
MSGHVRFSCPDCGILKEDGRVHWKGLRFGVLNAKATGVHCVTCQGTGWVSFVRLTGGRRWYPYRRPA